MEFDVTFSSNNPLNADFGEFQQIINEIPADQTYNPESANAQSGVAVAEAVENKIEVWKPNTLYRVGDYAIACLYESKTNSMYHSLIECKQEHTSTSNDGPPPNVAEENFSSYWKEHGFNVLNATRARCDNGGNEISATYSTKEELSNEIGSAKTHVLGQVQSQIGDTFDLITEDKSNVVSAINEVDTQIGDINSVLATVIEGSAVLPQSIINKVVEKAAGGVEKQIGNRFVTAVAVKDTGNIEIEPNAAYFVLSNTETGKINVFDRLTDEPVEYTGKMIGLITGNYGDTDPAAVLGFVGIYSSAVITKGTYLALDTEKTGSLSWEGEATVITVKNVKGSNI